MGKRELPSTHVFTILDGVSYNYLGLCLYTCTAGALARLRIVILSSIPIIEQKAILSIAFDPRLGSQKHMNMAHRKFMKLFYFVS